MAKFTVTFKDPDYSTAGLSRSEFNSSAELVAATKLRDSFLEWNEYLTVEFDTETGLGRAVQTSEARGN